ncbi:MAG: ABC transporter permease subunit, partial [Myxococcota bacterium]
MNGAWLIARDEWRLWGRSRLAVAGLTVFVLLLTTTALFTAARTTAEAHKRAHHQTEANQRFAEQPARHPHRMVHYGHYVFRPPAPLATFDPGVDAMTGESIFLEGHRQNDATFADDGAGVNIDAFGHLTPALLYQIFLPLLLIALGHGVILREHEAGTLTTILAQGTSVGVLVLGKSLALLGIVILFMIPAIATVAFAAFSGASVAASAALMLTYLAYFFIWTGIVVAVSLLCLERGLTLGILLLAWLTLT